MAAAAAVLDGRCCGPRATMQNMRLEYFTNVGSAPVLLTYGTSPAEAETLRAVAIRLAADGSENQGAVQIAQLPGFEAVDGCSLLAEVRSTELGVTPINESELAFRCALDKNGWRRVAGLLEPFAAARPILNPNGFQYLDESGSVEWIISGSRAW
jgi:hypothetical protein